MKSVTLKYWCFSFTLILSVFSFSGFSQSSPVAVQEKEYSEWLLSQQDITSERITSFKHIIHKSISTQFLQALKLNAKFFLPNSSRSINVNYLVTIRQSFDIDTTSHFFQFIPFLPSSEDDNANHLG